MCWWYGNASWPMWGWWVIPLIGMTLCILMCLFFRSRTTGWHCCGRDSARFKDLEEMKKEITALREEIGKTRGK